MVDLVPIKVKILIGPDGMHQYPAFNKVPPQLRGDLNWSKFFDRYTGWHYDKLSGHGEVDQRGDADDPHRNDDVKCWYGAACLPADFVEEAVREFPGLVEILPEASWERFYNERSHVHAETEILDLQDLQKLQARVALEQAGVAPTPSAEILTLRAEMLDPDNLRRGIRKNPEKTWEGYKTKKGITIRSQERKPSA